MVPGLGGKSLGRFDINQSRIRASGEEPSLIFSSWTAISTPLASMPALEAGRCALNQGEELFRLFHFRTFRAYFEESRDISCRSVLLDLAGETELDMARFINDLDGGKGQSELKIERDALLSKGDFTGVPTVIFDGRHPLIGAVPIQVYERALDKIGNIHR